MIIIQRPHDETFEKREEYKQYLQELSKSLTDNFYFILDDEYIIHGKRIKQEDIAQYMVDKTE